MIEQSAFLENRGMDLISNPYGYAADSIGQTLHFASDSISMSIPFIGKSCHSNEEIRLNPVVQTDTTLFYFILLAIFGVTMISLISKINLINVVKINFSEKSLQDFEKKQNNNNSLTLNYLFVIAIIFLTVIVYGYVKIENPFLSFKDLIYLLSGILLLFFLKIFIISLIGKIMRCGHLSKEFNRRIVLMYSSSIIFLMILALLVLSVSQNVSLILLIVTAIFLGFMILKRDGVFLKKQISKNRSFTFFFIYLCTFEILGIPLIAKLLYLIVL